MSYRTKAVANHFLDLAESHDEQVSPMKLQKLVYFGHGWWLGLEDKDLIDEPVEAWAFGPVVRSIYGEFRDYGMNPISSRATHRQAIPVDGDWEFGEEIAVLGNAFEEDDLEEVESLADAIWDIYGGYTAIQLSNLSHEEGSPWHQVYMKYNENLPYGAVVPRDAIRAHFQKLTKDDQ